MEDNVTSPFSAQGLEREADRTQRSISPLSRTSSVPGGGNDHHKRMEERKQYHVETAMLQDHEPNLPTDKGSKHRQATDRWLRLVADRWIWESWAMLVSLLSLVAIVLILRLHEGRPLPHWPLSITINALVSIFATIMSATMLMPIAAGIGQAKWHWFQRYHALSDVEVYDQASREPWGALKMLWDIRWRHISSLGALITVLALAIDPFVQQVASYKLEAVPLSQNSTLPVLLTYIGTEAGINLIQGPVYNGLFGLVCSQCVDVTDQIKYTESNKQVSSCEFGNYETPCLAALPNGLSLGFANNSDMKEGDPGIINTSGVLPPITLDKVGYALVNFSLIAIHDDGNGGPPIPIECSLCWCVNTYTAAVNNTIFTENLRSSWYNAASTLPLADLSVRESWWTLQQYAGEVVEQCVRVQGFRGWNEASKFAMHVPL